MATPRYPILRWLLLLGLLPTFWPFWCYGFPETPDGTLHLLRLISLHELIGQGVWYPRWLPNLFLGYGYPLLNFYAPAVYYSAEALRFMGLDAIAALTLLCCVIIIVAGYGAYWLALAVWRETLLTPYQLHLAALIVALAYGWNPYLLTNIYVRGAIPEAAAQAILPWLFGALHRLCWGEASKRISLLFALSLTALALTHNITLILAPPLILLYAFLSFWLRARQQHVNTLSPLHPVTRSFLIAGLLAMGVSAFFWLPALVERRYLTAGSYELSKAYMLREAWRWDNALSWQIPFRYQLAYSVPLGIVQLMIGVIGLAGLWRMAPQRWEWKFWALLCLICGLLIGEFALPMWVSVPLLLTVQFSWRLLIFINLGLALLAGGWVLLASQRTGRLGTIISVTITCLVIGLTMLGNFPQTTYLRWLTTDPANLGIFSVAQFENDTRGLGTGSVMEFLPKRASLYISDPPPGDEPAGHVAAVTLSQAGSFRLMAEVSATQSISLHFSQFYFPGWQAWIDQQPAPLYAESKRGLLTLDLPAGTHQIELDWRRTSTQTIAICLSLLTLFTASVVLLWRWPRLRMRGRVIGVQLSGALLALSLIFVLRPADVATALPPSSIWQAPVQPVVSAGIRLLGFYANQVDNQHLTLFPYWWVTGRTSQLRCRWHLIAADGALLVEVVSKPYFNTLRSDSWLANTIVDDAQYINLPPGTTGGEYQLWLQLEEVMADGSVMVHSASTPIGRLILPALSAQIPAPTQPLSLTFSQPALGQQIRLEGLDSAFVATLQTAGRPPLPLLRPGEQLHYTLYWRAVGDIAENYHSFLHLLDGQRQAIVKRDQLPGTFLFPPLLWNTGRLQREEFTLTIPETAPAGLYTPRLGLYRHKEEDLLLVTAADGTPLGDAYDLPPIKILRDLQPKPSQPLSIRVGELATLAGFDLVGQAGPGAQQVTAGAALTVTLYFRGEHPNGQEYIRYLHLRNPAAAPETAMAAQHDSPPQAGANPTWAWVEDEWIVDQVVLTIAPEAATGEYMLSTGFYRPVDGERLPLFDELGQPVLNNEVILGTISLQR